MGTGDGRRTRAPALVRAVAWIVAYVALLALGRAIILQPYNIGLVTPSAGVGLVWLATATSRRQLAVDTVLLTIATMVTVAITAGNPTQVALIVVTPIQFLLAIWLMRRLVPGIWGTGGSRPFTTLGEFGRLMIAFAVGSLVNAVVRTALGLLLIPEEVPSLLFGRFGRGAAAMATIGTVLLLVGGWVRERRDLGQPVLTRPSRTDVGHVLGIAALTGGILMLSFVVRPEAPTTYLLTLAVVWTALRFNPVITSLYCLLVGAAAVWLTILGIGPIAAARVEFPEARALLAQVFVVVLMVTGMVISLSRRQVLTSMLRLESSERSQALRAAELELMMGKLSDGVAVVEEGGRYIRSNDALRDIMTGRRHTAAFTGDVPPPTAYHLFHPDGRPLADDEYPYLRAIEGIEVSAETYHVRRPDVADYQVIEIDAYPVEVAPGELRRAMVVVRDVTAEKAHQDSLMKFAGTVAHDLNNPLSVIDGWAEALEEDLGASTSPDAAAAAPMVQHIRGSVEQMRAFISDLLAHAVARDQSLNWELVPLGALVKHIAANHDGPRSGGRVVAGDLLDVWADRVLLRQVLDNLVGNAFKYVAPGATAHVEVTAERLDDEWAKVVVRDNGIGIPAAQRQRVFDSFHRVTEEGYAGTGLGLAICKRIVERHGGTIWVDANPDGPGSSFEFTLPTTSSATARR